MFITFMGSTSRAGICVACLKLTTSGRRIVNRLHCDRCSIPWDDIMIHVGDIMSTVRGVQYRGDYLEYHGGCSIPRGDIMIHVEDIMSTVGVFSTVWDKSFVI